MCIRVVKVRFSMLSKTYLFTESSQGKIYCFPFASSMYGGGALGEFICP